jgi:hypothetical protein
MKNLEAAWRQARAACVAAGADYERVLDSGRANWGLIDIARIRLSRAQAWEASIVAEMKQLQKSA